MLSRSRLTPYSAPFSARRAEEVGDPPQLCKGGPAPHDSLTRASRLSHADAPSGDVNRLEAVSHLVCASRPTQGDKRRPSAA